MEGFVSVERAAELLGLSPETVYAWASRGLIPSYKYGGRRKFRESELEAFVQAHKDGPAQVVPIDRARRTA